VTQVDFYILQSDRDESRLTVACRLTEKALRQQQRVFLYPASAGEAKRLDEILWTFSQGSFIPHRIVDASEQREWPEPVLIGCEHPDREIECGVLINLAEEVPEFFSRYARVAEIVDADSARRDKGRERFRFYRDRGYELKTHQL
jgi:DNA polymerase III subunit chi